MRNLNTVSTAVLAAAASLALAACSASASRQESLNGASSVAYSQAQDTVEMPWQEEKALYDYAGESNMPAPEADMSAPEADMSAHAADAKHQGEKIVKTGNVILRTESFDESMEDLDEIANSCGGYIESSSIYSYGDGEDARRTYSGVIRVPSERFSEAKKRVEALGQLQSSNESADDMTGQYYDAKGRLDVKYIERERVIEMRELATDIEDILYLEERLGAINADIEIYESRLKNIDSLASYSTIYLDIEEVKELLIAVTSRETLAKRAAQSFRGSAAQTARFFENLAVFLAGASIPLAIIAILGAVAVLILKKSRVKKPAGN
ncbi:MAG: DUF4349 domain-containing protein [Clostridiales bacterium]|jgi:hypothetical protein|nr:DUF4349 domain-containing protein [Clostridiales bacterium]